MPIISILLRPVAVLFVLARVAAAWLAGSVVCDAGHLQEILSSRAVDHKELWKLCSSRYSEDVCLSAGRSVAASKPDEGWPAPPALYERFAGSACKAIEAAASQQRGALFLRAEPRQSNVEAEGLADIRSSSAAHQLSLDVARRYREGLKAQAAAQAAAQGDQSEAAAQSSHTTGDDLDKALRHKSIPIPHGSFEWESAHRSNSSANSSSNSSFSLDKAVKEVVKEHREQVNATSPDVVSRVNAFKTFVRESPPDISSAAAANSEANATHAKAGAKADATATAPAKEAKAAALSELVRPAAVPRRAFMAATGTAPTVDAALQAPGQTMAGASSVANELESVGSPHAEAMDDLVDEVMGRPLPDGTTIQIKATK